MRYLEKFETHMEKKTRKQRHDERKGVDLTKVDFDKIQDLLLAKMNEIGLEINIDNIYAELDLIRNDKKNSFLFWIIKDYLRENDLSLDFQNIMRVSAKFFEEKYGDVIRQYKADLKKNFELEHKKVGRYIMLPLGDEVIKVPERIGHNYIPVKILPMSDLHTKFSRHKRLKTFHHKGLKCVRCERVGEYLIAGKDRGGQIHLDIYTKDFELMTVDHIKPKSLGGTYDIENLDPMCNFCNSEKSNKWEEPEAEEA